MTDKNEKLTVITITITVAIIVVVMFFMNGAEKDDSWLYLTSFLSVLAIPILAYYKKQN